MCSPATLAAQTVPTGFVDTPIFGFWPEVAGLTFDDVGTMYVWERGGRVWIIENDVKLPVPLIDIREEVGAWDDHGFLGFAVHPNFRQNGYIYLLYVVDHHYLSKYGTPQYNPNTNEFHRATIGRITRYTARASDNFHSVDPASRTVLLGETASTGCPILSITHGVGSLVFGTDGTLLVSCGDGAGLTDAGSDPTSYYVNGLSEGIIKPKENVGAYRAQMIDSLSGKILRLDPVTGNGVPSNPYYDPAAPRDPRSRVWALGVRNPFRMTLQPVTGSHDPAAGNPGILYTGNVGYNAWEELEIISGPRQNLGWPVYEGFEQTVDYLGTNPDNQDAPNPLFGIGGCTQRYFKFRDLLKQDTLATPSWPNPCNPAQQVPESIPHFVHKRPLIDWQHGSGPSRTGTFAGTDAAVVNLGAAGSPISGPQFGGNCSIGGTFYQGTDFPATYQNTYFFGDLGNGWIRNLTFDSSGNPVSVRNFATGVEGIAFIGIHPFTGAMYYSMFYDGLHKVTYAGTGNQPPTAVASSNVKFGPSPLTVQFTGNNSTDPEGNPLTYLWDFGDGSLSSAVANPLHTYNAPAGVPTRYDARLTVTDNASATSSTTLAISVNNTPPSVAITSPPAGTKYPLTGDSTYNLTAFVTDAEHVDSQLLYEWQKILHHNNHTHPSPIDTNHVTSTVLSPIGCDGNLYFYRVVLTVTDPAGLSGRSEVDIYPECSNTPPTISAIANRAIPQNTSTGPIGFAVGDAEIPATYVTVTGSSSNATLVPAGNIVFGGSDVNRTVTVTPAANQTGTATITVTASDGQLAATSAFVLTVTATNTAPTISDIVDQIITRDTPTGPIAFTVGDAETPAASLTLSGSSSNSTLVPNSNIVFGGSGASRTVSITPAANQTGSATITITVSDGALTAIDTFVVLVVNAPADFTLSGSPASQTVAPGGSTNYGVTITPSGGFAAPVTLSVSGLPAGATGSFTPNPATSTATLAVTTSAGTPTGTYPLTLTGVSGSLTHTATVSLVVSASTITVTAPNTAVTWQSRTSRNVTFTHNLGVGHLVNIDVSRDGGTSWTPVGTLTTTTATSGTYAWVVSGPSTTQARIRISSASVPASDMSNVNFTITAAITVTAPSSAVTWGAGSTRTITWTHSLGVSQTVDITFSPDNGATWIPMASGVPNSTATTGSYTGLAPAVVTTQGRVRVTWSTDSTESDMSDGFVTLAAPAVTVTAPNTNVSWLIGSAKNITWTHNLGTAESVQISLSRDGGSTWSVLAASRPNTGNTSGTFSWIVNGPATTTARVRITWTRNGAVQDLSDVNFRVTSPITVTAPNTAVTWAAGSMRAVAWTHSLGAAQTFDVDFSADNGVTWVPMATGVPAATATTGTYTSAMPTTLTTQARVRVSPTGLPLNGDASNVAFTVAAPSVTVTAPNTNVTWTIASARGITWTHNLGTLESVKIDISRDGGSTWFVLAASLVNTASTSGTFTWTVTAPATTTARIRVTWVRDGTVSDISNVNFQIQ